MSEENANADLEADESEVVEFKIKIDSPDSYIYSNVAGVSISPWDVRLHFADVAPKDKTTVSKTVAGIILPPEHAVALAFLLLDHMQGFEQQFGPIRNQRWRQMIEGKKRLEEQQRKAKVDIEPSETGRRAIKFEDD